MKINKNIFYFNKIEKSNARGELSQGGRKTGTSLLLVKFGFLYERKKKKVISTGEINFDSPQEHVEKSAHVMRPNPMDVELQFMFQA